MEKYLQVHIITKSPERVDIITAELGDGDFYAFEEIENGLIAYIKSEDFNGEMLTRCLLNDEVYTAKPIENKNWNEDWETSFQPVEVDSFAGIRAHFHGPLKEVKNEIVITPKMSFGTGHHATTYLMVKAMETLPFRNASVLDFGTGTGVLAILSEMLGAAAVLAIDNNEWSIHNARENIIANKCKNILVEQRSSIKGIPPKDIILANINLNVLIKNAVELAAICNKDSTLLISGFFVSDKDTINSAFFAYGFQEIMSSERHGWQASCFKKIS